MSHFFIALIISVLCLHFEIYSEMLKGDVSAKSAILINAKTGAVLYEKNAHASAFPASITKVATALYAIEKKGHALEELITANQEAISAVSPLARRSGSKHPSYRLEFGGTHMGIKTGEVLSLRTLLYGLMLVSANDAANLIAQHVSGSVPKFMEELDLYLKEKGCKETRFSNPHGLSFSDHQTTAYDMAKITQMALNFPLFREIVKTVRYLRPESNKQEASFLLQGNRLLKPGPFFYPKAIGVKTGYTLDAGYTLVAAAEDPERSLIAVLLNCESMEQRYRDAQLLFEIAFAEKKVLRKLFSKEHDLFSRIQKGAQGPLRASLAEDLKISYYPSEEPELKAFLEWRKIKLPIKKGERLGNVCLSTKEGVLLKKEPLYAIEDVKASAMHRFFAFWPETFAGKSGLVIAILSLMAFTSGGAFVFLKILRKRELSK